MLAHVKAKKPVSALAREIAHRPFVQLGKQLILVHHALEERGLQQAHELAVSGGEMDGETP